MAFRLSSLLVAVALMAGPVFAADKAPAERVATEVANLGADQYLDQKVSRVLQQLGATDLTADERAERFRNLVTEIFDTGFISRFVLGSYWNEISPSERERFTNSLVELQVVRWAQRFKPSADDYAVNVGAPTVNEQGHHVVPMTITGAAGTSGKLDLFWVLRKQDGEFKVFDVIFAGTSLLVASKNEYQSFIQKEGSVAKLTDKIEAQVRAN